MIRIGDFSRLSQTPISTLRYYDKVGLLKPLKVDHLTGYRYYTIDQLAHLHRILAWKDLGFSLEEIARLLTENLPARQLHAMLRRQRETLREQAQGHHERQERLDAWLKNIEKEHDMTAYTIRDARIESDLPDLARLTRPYDGEVVTEDLMRRRFEFKPEGRIQRRIVSTDEHDSVTGYGGYVHEPESPEGHFTAWAIVDPAHRGRGIGAALWDFLLNELKQQGATRLMSDIPDNDPSTQAFVERRGFVIDQHLFNFELELAAFDETPFLPAIAGLEAQGIRFCSLADFPDTSETRRMLYDLNSSDMLENANTVTPWTYATFEAFVILAPWFRRDGQLLAVDGDAWVGMAAVGLFPDTRTALNMYTGVLRPYRGRKIATSLKVLAARYARENGAVHMQTDSNLRNAPILAINRNMGYQPQPGKYMIVCDL